MQLHGSGGMEEKKRRHSHALHRNEWKEGCMRHGVKWKEKHRKQHSYHRLSDKIRKERKMTKSIRIMLGVLSCNRLVVNYWLYCQHMEAFAGRFDVFKKAFQFERFAYYYVLYVACHKIGIGTERAWAATWATLSGRKNTAHLAPSSSGFHIAFGNCWFWDPRWLPVWVSANQPDTGLVWRSWRHQTVDGPAGPDAECSTLFSRHLTVQVLMVETAPTRIPWLLFSATILPVMFPWTCQDWFHSEEELREQLGLLNDVRDLASPCVVHPCLNSPWCPKIGWGVRIGWRCSAEL